MSVCLDCRRLLTVEDDADQVRRHPAQGSLLRQLTTLIEDYSKMSVDDTDSDSPEIVNGPITAATSSPSAKALDTPPPKAGPSKPSTPLKDHKGKVRIPSFLPDPASHYAQRPETKLMDYEQVPGIASSSREMNKFKQCANPHKRSRTEAGMSHFPISFILKSFV